MEKLKLDAIALEELTETEMRFMNGGSWGKLFEALALSLIHNWKDVREGFEDGYNGKSRY